MDYTKYSAEDLALDEKFQKWVLNPDPETNGFWDQWLEQNPEQDGVVNEAIELIRTAGLSKDQKLNEAYLSVWNQLSKHASQKDISIRVRQWQFGKIAAAVTLLIVSGYLLWTRFGVDDAIEYQTAYGEIREFVLEDGSKVTLNSNSHLTLPADWNEQELRKVALEGEAFFEIVKTADRKGFEVTTVEKVRIYVLGTKFNVNTRHQQVKVYLQSGKVKVNSAIGDAMMNPGDVVIYKNGDTALQINRNIAEATQLLSWTEQVFIFNDTPLTDVIRELEDNYGFRIDLQNKMLADKRITAKIPRKDAAVLLDVLAETLDIRIERDGTRIIFR